MIKTRQGGRDGRFRPHIAVCVGDSPALVAILETIHKAGLHSSTVPLAGPLSWIRPHVAPDALLYDLAPFTPAASTLVRDVRKLAPHLPILLYPPPRYGVGELLRRCARLPMVQVELQDPVAPIAKTLRPALGRIFRDAPAGKTLEMMSAALPGRPHLTRHFLTAVLYGLQAGRFPGRVRLDSVARTLETTRRALERSWKANALMPPRELAAWAVLLLVACSAETLGVTSVAAGRALGFDAQQLYRLRRRCLPHGGTLDRTTLSSVWVAFARRCRERRLPSRLLVERMGW